MPNIKSAKKRVLVNAKKTEQNKSIRSNVKTAIKKIDLLIKENKIEELGAALSAAFKAIDMACTKKIYHKNTASNKKAKLAKKVNAIAKVEVVKDEPVAPVAEPVVETVVEAAPVVEEAPKKTRKPRAKKADKAE